MPYDSNVFWDKRMKTWIAEVWEFGSNRVTTGRRIWWGAYDSREEAKKAAKAAKDIRELAAEAKAARKKHGWKVNATRALIKARHGPGRS